MRSVRLLRSDVFRAFKPLWGPQQSHICVKASTELKNEEGSKDDPYEGNFSFTECDQYTKVTLIGAAGRVGRTLSLLLKTCPLVDHLCLFDIDKSVKGIGVDISHIDTKCCVSYVCGMKNIDKALDAPDVVVIAAGHPASPQLTQKKLFLKNAPIVAGLSEACARFCPKACVVLITSPINSLVPVMGEVYQMITNKMPSRKLFGLTTLDVVRANTFVAEVVRKDPNKVIVPVVGGTSQDTIVPVISQMKPCCKIKRNEVAALTECLKRAESNLADCQNCGTPGSSSLSTAYAAFRFTSSLIMALKGAQDIIECAYVKSDIIPELEYLASPLKLGICGIEHNFGYPHLSDYEVALMEQAAPVLISDIEMGKCFVVRQKKNQKSICRKRSSPATRKCSNALDLSSFCRPEGKKSYSETCKKRPECGLEKGSTPPMERCKGTPHHCRLHPQQKAVALESGSAFMVVESEGKKDFFLGSLWLAGGQSSVWDDSNSEDSRKREDDDDPDKHRDMLCFNKCTSDDYIERQYELAGLERSGAILVVDIEMGKRFARGIEHTVRRGLVWKALRNRVNLEEAKTTTENGRNPKKSMRRAEEIKDLVPVTSTALLLASDYSEAKESAGGWFSRARAPLRRLLYGRAGESFQENDGLPQGVLDSVSYREDFGLRRPDLANPVPMMLYFCLYMVMYLILWIRY